ncbi:MAG: (4Fe-4S)-binding protein [Chloroflexota bacterium]|nr:(4Fe-4S)-binding protein [Chloroflexota bacterium]
MDAEERKQPGVAREYRDERIAVYWAPQYCIHTANCLNAQPEVFDSMRRPWIVLAGADADAVADAVMSCPTGALTYERLDGEDAEPQGDAVTVTAFPNGPLFVRGSVTVTNGHGEIVRQGTRMALCRCGESANKPFCDATHRKIGFRAP